MSGFLKPCLFSARRSGNEAVTTAEGEAAEVDERDGAPLMPRKKRTFATDSSPSGGN